jgi:hypothetical protein
VSPSSKDEVFSDEPWLSIRWDDEHRCVYAEFKGFANSAEIRAGAMKILEAARNKHATLLVSDNRGLEGVANEDQLWLRDTWMPLAVASGITRIGVVVAPRGLGKLATEEIIGKFGKTAFVTRTFGSPAEATKWVAGA